MELEFKWSETLSGYAHNLMCREAGSLLDRWDGVASLSKYTTAALWTASFTWRVDDLLPATAYIYRQKWDDVDKAKKAVERKARGLIGVLQIQGRWI